MWFTYLKLIEFLTFLQKQVYETPKEMNKYTKKTLLFTPDFDKCTVHKKLIMLMANKIIL